MAGARRRPGMNVAVAAGRTPSKIRRSRHGIYVQLASLVPEEEYIHRAPYGTIEGLRLHAINHAQKDTLQEFRFQQTQEVHGSDFRISSSEGPALHYLF